MHNVFDPSSNESASNTAPFQNCPQLDHSAQAKGVHARNTEWIDKTACTSYLFYNESSDGLIVEEKTNLPQEHLMTCLQHDLPRAVLACAVLVDSSAYEPTLALRQGFPSQTPSHILCADQ
jgi:hypothetical protein